MYELVFDGQKIAYERRGSGIPMVLIHGYPLDHTIWNPVIPLLEDTFDLIMPDLRGFGASGVSRKPYTIRDLACDVAALLDQLKIDQAVITGHSMGGYVALAFMDAYPRRVLGLGMIASQAIADSPERKTGRYQTAEQVEAVGVGDVAGSMPSKLTFDLGLQSHLRELIFHQQPKGVADALRAMAERSDLTHLLSESELPVVIVHGLSDMLIPIERARENCEIVKKRKLVELNTGHMPMMENPRAVAKALMSFKL